MNRIIARLECALCWTALAPVLRARRQRHIVRISRELHDRQRIDQLLNDMVRQHADLLA